MRIIFYFIYLSRTLIVGLYIIYSDELRSRYSVNERLWTHTRQSSTIRRRTHVRRALIHRHACTRVSVPYGSIGVRAASHIVVGTIPFPLSLPNDVYTIYIFIISYFIYSIKDKSWSDDYCLFFMTASDFDIVYLNVFFFVCIYRRIIYIIYACMFFF